MDCDGCIDSGASVWRAAQLMCRTGLPFLVVTELTQGAAVPLGILSSIDIVTHVVARNLDVRSVSVGEVLGAKAAPALSALLRRL